VAFWQALKGVLTRPAPEWYLPNFAFAGGTASGGASQSTLILWNNSSPGVNFYVYREEISGQSAHFGIAEGPIAQTLGSVNSTPGAVFLGSGSPPGQVYQSTGTNPDSLILAGNLGGYLPVDGMLNRAADYPLIVIPPNMGWVVTRNDVGNGLAVNWWFLWK